MEINTLELPKLPQQSDNSQLWNWLQFLSNNREEELTMLAEKNEKIEKAVLVLKELSQDEKTRLLYEEREKARRDYESRLEGAYEQGEINKAIDMAKKALNNKMQISEIMEYTGLTHEEIEELAKGTK